MNIHVRGDHHLDVTPALREYVEKRLSRISRHLESPSTQEVQVTLSVTRGIHAVEVTIPLAHVLLRAEERSSDMYASIDMVTDKLEKQIGRYKDKVGQKVGHRKKVEGVRAKVSGGSLGNRAQGSVAVRLDEDEDEIVRIKEFEMKPMHVSEAILQMDMLGHDFYVFANAETERTSVVYRRRDGQYGLILAQ